MLTDLRRARPPAGPWAGVSPPGGARRGRSLRNQPDHTERRQGDLRRERLLVPADRLRLDAAEVAAVRAAVEAGVRVDRLAPAARARQAEAVAPARRGGQGRPPDEHPPPPFS